MEANIFFLVYGLTILFILLLMSAPVILVFVLIIFIKKKSNKSNKEITDVIDRHQKEKERLIQEELNVKKLKYKRTRCKYCDSLNKIDAVVCINCGGVLSDDIVN